MNSPLTAQTVWTGPVNTDWNTPATGTLVQLPRAFTSVVIPNSTPNTLLNSGFFLINALRVFKRNFAGFV